MLDDAKVVKLEFPPKMQVLFSPAPIKVFYGGRGGAKSWGFARALLSLGTQRQIRVLCARELQNSIADSVHKLLSDQIDKLGLGGFYEIQVAKIIGANGTTFSFEGIRNNAAKVKSYEGIDYCWVEEAAKVSQSSWEVLLPTIRKSGSEVWISFNPELATDYTYQHFVLSPPTGSVVVKMNYSDNPWFNETTLVRQMQDMKERDYDKYLNIWEGHPVVTLDGAVYAKEIRRMTQENRVGLVPYERTVPVDVAWDLGRADQTAIWFFQTVGMQQRLLAYYEASGEEIHHYIKYCQGLGYAWGTHWLPHDAKAKRLGTKRTIEEILKSHFDTVRIVPRLSVEDGINAARTVFPNCWFDERKCEAGLNRLRRYSYKVVDGQFSNKPLHDENSDGADAFRYFAVSLASPGGNKRAKLVEKLTIRPENPYLDVAPNLGWMH